MSQGSTWDITSYFLQILEADLDDIKFPRGSILLQYVDDLLLFSLSQGFSQKDSIHLLKLLASKGPKFTKEKLQFAQTQVWYLGHLISEQGLHSDPDRFHGVLSFLKPKTKCPLGGFLGLVGYCQNWISNFLWPNLCNILLNNNNLDPILWEEPDNIVSKALKESLMNPLALGHCNYQIPFLLFVYEKEKNALGIFTQKHGTTIDA